MIGLILLFFVGKAFYVLAENHGKAKLPFAVLGVASYYAGLFLGGMIIAICYEVLMDGSIDDINDMLLGLLGLPFGVLTCWGLYTILKRSWSRKETFSAPEEILDANLGDQHSDNA